MDESLFIFGFFVFFFVFAALIYCFLSTCLGLEIRRSDIFQALAISNPPNSRTSRSRGGGSGGTGDLRSNDGYGYEYEMDEMGRPMIDAPGSHGGIRGGGMGAAFRMDEYELMNRGGPGRGFF